MAEAGEKIGMPRSARVADQVPMTINTGALTKKFQAANFFA